MRDFLQKELPPGWGGVEWDQYEEEGLASVRAVAQGLRKKLAARGWLGMTWPREYGGLEAPFMKEFVLVEELCYQRAPGRDMYGTSLVGPCILHFGTEKQKREHLPRIARGEVVWCVGMSEPNAGSDLASLQTRAVEQDDCFVVNGQKIWTSGAHVADWCMLYVRTDPQAPRRKGISCLLVDLNTPGITRRPIEHMTGLAAFDEVFYDNVRIPRACLLGEPGSGWQVAMMQLDYERPLLVMLAANARRNLEDLITFARSKGCSALERHRLAELAMEVEMARLLSYRVAWMQSQGHVPTYQGDMVKLHTAAAAQHLANVGMQVLGLYGQLGLDAERSLLTGRFRHLYLNSVAMSIAGGTAEIQRNTIALMGLGLPR